MVYSLTDDETRLAEAAEAAEACKFPPHPWHAPIVSIRGTTIRRLLYGLPVRKAGHRVARVIKIAAPGLRLDCANISGPIELWGARGPDGAPLPSLALNNCVLLDQLDFRRAHLSALSLAGSRIVSLDGREARIDGSLDLAGVGAPEPHGVQTGPAHDGSCWVDLRGSVVAGSIHCDGARLRASESVGRSRDMRQPTRYALDLSDTQIAGALHLGPGFSAEGGASLALARIGGDVRILDAALVAPNGRAFNGVNARIEGSLKFQSSASAMPDLPEDGALFIQGGIDLRGVSVGGDLRIHYDNRGLSWQSAQADRSDRSISTGQVIDLSAARVTGNLELAGVDAHQIAGSNLDIGDNLFLERLRVWLFLQLNNGVVQGTLRVRLFENEGLKLSLDAPEELRAPTAEIDFSDLKVGVLDDAGSDGFGQRVALELQGFAYGRIEKNESTATAFRPSHNPFRIAAKFLKKQAPAWVWPALVLAMLTGCALSIAGQIVGGWLWPTAFALAYVLWGVREMRDSTPDVLDRLRWLDLQHIPPEPGRPRQATLSTYKPEPYERLIRTYREQAEFESAKRVAGRRLVLERKLAAHVLARPMLWLFELLFDYGLSPLRAMSVFVACLVIGTLGVAYADGGWPKVLKQVPLSVGMRDSLSKRLTDAHFKPALVIETDTVRTLTSLDAKKHRIPVLPPLTQAVADHEKEMECGDQIEPALYAADMFVPALDLRQEAKCGVSTEDSFAGWRLAKAVYALLGWIVTSLTILTLSGILRRQAEA